jgi:hypothetical protein
VVCGVVVGFFHVVLGLGDGVGISFLVVGYLRDRFWDLLFLLFLLFDNHGGVVTGQCFEVRQHLVILFVALEPINSFVGL